MSDLLFIQLHTNRFLSKNKHLCKFKDSRQPSYSVSDGNFKASFFTLASSKSYLLKYSATSIWFTSSLVVDINASVVGTSVDWDCRNISLCLWEDIGTLEKPEGIWGNCSLLITGPEKHCCSELPQGTGITSWSRRNKLSFVQRLFTLLILSTWNITHCLKYVLLHELIPFIPSSHGEDGSRPWEASVSEK